MSETSQLINSLKSHMRARNITYKDLSVKLNLSEASIKRIFANKTFTLERFEAVCSALDMSISQLVKLTGSNQENETEYLTSVQEEHLAADPTLLAVWYLLAHEWSPEEISADYQISRTQIEKHLKVLEKVKLLERHPGGKVRMLTGPNTTWRPNGPTQLTFENQARTELFNDPFSGPLSMAKFIHGELSESSIRHIQKKLDELIKIFNAFSQVDVTLPKKQTHSIGMSLAMRPWVYSVFSQLKKRT